MSMTLTEKILRKHLVDGEYEPGKEIGIAIDQTLTQDATGTMACLQFESMRIKAIRTELSVSYVDHNTVQVGFENADDHRYLQTFAEKYGLYYSRAGNGICHQVHLERFARPGKTLLGSDSHTPTAGGMGMIAIGAGGLDVAVAMGGGPFYTKCPKVLKVELQGRLKPWVTAKDVVLKMLELKSTKGNVGWVVEYAGSGLRSLSVPERATITNMGAEMGITTSIFPSDKQTRKFLEMQGRAGQWQELRPDKDAVYDDEMTIDLSKLVPLVATPHSPGNIQEVSKLRGTNVDQVMIGSCTNSSYADLMQAAGMLKGKHVHDGVSVGVAPGSRQVLQMISDSGALQTFLDAGVRILECACGFCIGNSMSPGSAAVSVRTSNRNFEGRSGTPSARLYLASPATAVACALKGRITDPRSLRMKEPRVRMPAKFVVDDAMMAKPKAKRRRKDVKVEKGPNIQGLPRFSRLADTVNATVAIKAADEVTTDHIMPAGKYLKLRSNIPEYARHVFEPLDPDFYDRALANKEGGADNAIVAGLSYGQGSSREHAALCPMYLGVKIVIARSIERIHRANLINFGILPLVFKNKTDYARVREGDRLELSDVRRRVQNGEALVVRNITRHSDIDVLCEISERERKILLAGGLLAYVKKKASKGEKR